MTTTEPLSAEELAEIRARVNKTTPGPWAHVDHGKDGTNMGCGEVITWGEGVEAGSIAAPSGDCYPRFGYSPFEDMAFIAAARQDVPRLLDEAERLRERLGRISGWHSRMLGPGGTVNDLCNECGHTWPCDSRRLADGEEVDNDD